MDGDADGWAGQGLAVRELNSGGVCGWHDKDRTMQEMQEGLLRAERKGDYLHVKGNRGEYM